MTEHSPQLDEPLRSAERAALDIAVKALKKMRDGRYPNATVRSSATAGAALRVIKNLVPDAVKP